MLSTLKVVEFPEFEFDKWVKETDSSNVYVKLVRGLGIVSIDPVNPANPLFIGDFLELSYRRGGKIHVYRVKVDEESICETLYKLVEKLRGKARLYLDSKLKEACGLLT